MTQTTERQSGGLYVQTAERQQLAFPLKHTTVQAKIAGNLARVEVTQSFENPFTTTLEAVYIFPLPDEAAVDDMLIRIGDRTIQGSIKKRQEAQQIYEQAKRQGRTAGLLEQERDNIFTQSLANIKPGEQINVVICYTESLKFTGATAPESLGGSYEFAFPMVVGPRYVPGNLIEENAIGSGSAAAPMMLNQDTDLVPDASRLNAPILPPGTRSGHDISVTVEINAGVAIQEIHSPSHQIQIIPQGAIAQIKLAGGDTIPNKDLILRYQVSGAETQTTVLTEAGDRGGHFAVYLIPAIQYRLDQMVPKDVVFLIDTSGSQAGAPLAQCQELMRRFIQGLNPDDTFSIIDFSDTTQQLSPVPLPNTPQNQQQAIRYVNRLTAGGGTEMLRGIRAVLNFPVTDPGRLRSIVLLTDGYIGNENQILAEVQRHLQPSTRLYSFGAGSSVNRFLLNRVAEIGRGISRVIRHDEPTDQVTEQFFRQINNPVLTNIQLQWEGAGSEPIFYPSAPPDLFAEQPLVLFGRKEDKHSGKLHISGIAAGGKRYQQTFQLEFAEAGNPAIAQLWGRARIKNLMNQMLSGDTKAGVEAVTDTALAYQLLSQYTAFVAVSDEVRVDATEASVSVQVPVEMPEGVSYEGVFGNVAYSVPDPVTQIPIGEVSLSVRAYNRMRRQMLASDISSEEFDVTLISPSMAGSVADADFSLAPPAMSPPAMPSPKLADDEEFDLGVASQKSFGSISEPLQIVQATGLDANGIALLTQHLQSIQLSPGFSGDIVFEFQISKGRVRQIVLNESVSSLKEQTVIEAVRRSLQTWRPSQELTATVHLTLRVQS
ncbi:MULTISPECIES: VIT domain-containing protein [Trichocoleus]|uniref:After-VIT domain-containing protein n=1 Tax=Trichocoleus desertorum GB2-A4 TaxID=2933944 RepID=A0ABV0JDL4_9CYAN|nr:VIT domain-containing protein [Trichocoleus sp. FACHB-46]MBD1860946.1 after-VIT domain-containing protein [Trichocoleus sp. FACHB-46]